MAKKSMQRTKTLTINLDKLGKKFDYNAIEYIAYQSLEEMDQWVYEQKTGMKTDVSTYTKQKYTRFLKKCNDFSYGDRYIKINLADVIKLNKEFKCMRTTIYYIYVWNFIKSGSLFHESIKSSATVLEMSERSIKNARKKIGIPEGVFPVLLSDENLDFYKCVIFKKSSTGSTIVCSDVTYDKYVNGFAKKRREEKMRKQYEKELEAKPVITNFEFEEDFVDEDGFPAF